MGLWPTLPLPNGIVRMGLGRSMSLSRPLFLATVLALVAWTQAHATRRLPSCNQFDRVQTVLRTHGADAIERMVPGFQWLDSRYRDQDRTIWGLNITKTVVLAVIGRANWASFVFMPNRAEAATMTGFYTRTPENFASFLLLNSRQACNYLSMTDRSATDLRHLVRTLYARVLRAGL